MKYSFCISIIAITLIFCCTITKLKAENIDPVALQKTLDLYVSDPSNVGAAVLLSNSSGRHIITSGYTNTDKSGGVQGDTRYHIASLSKMFTAVIIFHLIEEGKLSLDDKFIDILGDPFNARLDNYKDSTIRMALEHSTGMVDFIGSAFDETAIKLKDHDWTALEALSYILDQPATHKAGTAYAYNSTAFVLLGEVIHKITGEDDFNVTYDQVIFSKAGMKSTYFPNGIRPRSEKLARGYMHVNPMSKNLIDMSDIKWGERLADGGLVSTVIDLEKFSKALFVDKTLLTDNSLDLMMDIKEEMPALSEGGRGLMVLNRHDLTQSYPRLYGHLGRYLGYRSFSFINPETEETIILLANSSHFSMHNFLQEIGLFAPYK